MPRPPPPSPLFPYTPLFRSAAVDVALGREVHDRVDLVLAQERRDRVTVANVAADEDVAGVGLERSEEHTSELQSRRELVCRLLLEKKKNGGASAWVKPEMQR